MAACIITCSLEELLGLDPGCNVVDLSTRELGRKGEQAAVRHLEKQGYDILELNWSCRYGEADIIAVDGETLVFVEVKTRRSIEAGLPEEAVTRKKMARYEKIAMSYLLDCDLGLDFPVRFDAIGLCVIDDGRALLRHHKSCFDLHE